jgi:hypothetical protein
MTKQAFANQAVQTASRALAPRMELHPTICAPLTHSYAASTSKRRRGRPRYCLPSCPNFIVPTTSTPIGPTGIYTSVWLGELTIFACAWMASYWTTSASSRGKWVSIKSALTSPPLA